MSRRNTRQGKQARRAERDVMADTWEHVFAYHLADALIACTENRQTAYRRMNRAERRRAKRVTR